MRLVRTFIIVGLAIGLSLFCLWLRRPEHPSIVTFDESKPAGSVMDLANDEQVISLVINRGSESVVLKKDKGTWKIASPIQVPAENFIVDGMVKALKFSKRQREFDAPSDLSEFGLNNPKLEVGVITSEGTHERTLVIGDKGLVGEYRYAMWKGGPKAFFISENLFASLNKSLYSLRNKQLLHIEPYRVTLIRITEPQYSFSLELTDKGWIVRKGLRNTLPADPGAVRFYVSQLSGLFAKRFYDGKSWKYSSFGLYPEKRCIEVAMKGDEPIFFIVGREIAEIDGFFAVVKGKTPVVVVAYDKIQGLFKEPEDFEKNTFLTLGGVSKLQIDVAGELFSWGKVDGLWKPLLQNAVISPEAPSIPSCADLLSLLGDLSYREKIHAGLLDDPAFPKATLFTVRCFREKGNSEEAIEFLRSGDSGFVRLEGDSTAYRISLFSLNEVVNLAQLLVSSYDS